MPHVYGYPGIRIIQDTTLAKRSRAKSAENIFFHSAEGGSAARNAGAATPQKRFFLVTFSLSGEIPPTTTNHLLAFLGRSPLNPVKRICLLRHYLDERK